MSKFTPGPWEVSGSVMERRWIDGSLHLNRLINIHDEESDYPTLVEVYERNNPNEAEANARLIAAAPELLGALKEMDDCYWDTITDGKGCRCARCGAASVKAQAAIAKATA